MNGGKLLTIEEGDIAAFNFLPGARCLHSNANNQTVLMLNVLWKTKRIYSAEFNLIWVELAKFLLYSEILFYFIVVLYRFNGNTCNISITEYLNN